jgi:hypothetical protein
MSVPLSAPITSRTELCQALEAVLADAKKELEHRREFNDDDWAYLRSLTARVEKLPPANDSFPQKALLRATCAYAADVQMHGHTDRADEMLTMLSQLEKFAQNSQHWHGGLQLALYTYLALMADLADNHLVAADWATKTDRFMEYAPSVPAEICIWLMRGQVEHQGKRRKALLRALKLLKQLDGRQEDLLLEYRTRVALYELYRAQGLPLHRWWHFRKAEDVSDELLLLRKLDQAEVSGAAREQLPQPLLQLVDLR